MFNALGDHYSHLQTSINDLFTKSTTTSADVRDRLLLEESVLMDNNSSGTTALAAVSTKPTKPLCANCKRTHRTEYCIAPGGQMAGKTLEEARAAQEAARNAQRAGGKGRNSRSTTPAPNQSGNANTPAKTVTINGQCYVLSTPTGPPAIDPSSALSAISMPSYDEEEYLAVVATTDDAHVSLNWDSHARSTTTSESGFLTNTTSHRSPLARIDELPFILDSGATCHISPEPSDFKSLTPIPHHPVKGLNGSAVYAVGVGEIELRIAAGHVLKLTNVLYIPDSSVRLISIMALNKSGNYTTHFDSTGCWVTNKSNTTLVRGTLSNSKRLYVLSTKVPCVQHKPCQTDSIFHARTPDLETWHRRLGHCNVRAIIEMAKNEVSEGMPIDLSTLPAKCHHCALGKQTHATVPKTREGPKATKRLERVYVDLCGPMAVTSRAGNLYSMNIIDDFSGYVWTLPLRSKANAFPTLQIWHKAVTVQTGDLLKILVSDNGELISNAMQNWCQANGVEHQRTAPYTSAHNGRAERLHRTILGKARTMRIACNAPGFLWDEFCATAAYLTTLTAATANLGKTPFELWFGRKPSLSHLREIGCNAFVLQLPAPSKIYARSKPYILIGYSPHSKAYRLWDPVSSRVFTSFHVTFTEHLDSMPSPLHPGTTLGTNSAVPPPSWDIHGPNPAASANPPPKLLPPPSDSPPYPPDYLASTIPSHPPPQNNHQTSHTARNVIDTSRSTIETSTNTVNTSTNTVTASNNTINASRNTVDSSPNNDNAPPSHSTLDNNNNTVNSSSTSVTNDDTQSNNNTSTTQTPQHPLTITIPPRPPLRRSARIAALNDVHYAFLSQYSNVRDTHDLIPTDLSVEDPALSVDFVLAALSDGSITPVPTDNDEPLWAKALASDEREYWIAGAREELKSLQDLNVFVLVPRSAVPRHQRPLKGKLVCKRKRDDTDRVVRYKVRYVAKGFAQRYGIDYDKTTAPTVRPESFRTILHLTASLDWDLRQFDIKTAFLNGVLPETETMFMEQPEGFEVAGKEEWVMKLMKSIYGMKQAGRIWNQSFHKAVTEWGFERLDCEWCVYRRTSSTGTVIFAVHVDDIIAAGSCPGENDRFRDLLKSKWEITQLGEPKLALGIAISRNRAHRTISLSQTAKIDDLVEEFGQQNARSVDTPMVAGLQLKKPDKNEPVPTEVADWIEKTPYRSLVGSLMYLSVATRPDISYAVGRLSSFLDCYRLEHWEAAIRVLRYLKGTRSYALTLGGTGPLTLLGYSDSDYANCPDTSRSIGGYCFSLGSGMISWSSRKQSTVADSSCYAEYIALHNASHEVIFLRQLLEGLRFLPSGATRLFCDNDAASRLSEDHVWHPHTKHIRVKYHYTRELVLAGDVAVVRVGSKDNTADILTKPLARMEFQRLRHYLGVRESSCSSPK